MSASPLPAEPGSVDRTATNAPLPIGLSRFNRSLSLAGLERLKIDMDWVQTVLLDLLAIASPSGRTDHVQQYIGDTNDRSTLVTEVTEALSKELDSHVLVVASGQSALTPTAQLQKLTDRYTIRVQLSDQDVEAVIRFVLRLAEELDLTGLWGFQYALTCSRPRLDAFGGGAHVIDLGARKSIGWTSSQEWLAAALNGEDVDA